MKRDIWPFNQFFKIFLALSTDPSSFTRSFSLGESGTRSRRRGLSPSDSWVASGSHFLVLFLFLGGCDISNNNSSDSVSVSGSSSSGWGGGWGWTRASYFRRVPGSFRVSYAFCNWVLSAYVQICWRELVSELFWIFLLLFYPLGSCLGGARGQVACMRV